MASYRLPLPVFPPLQRPFARPRTSPRPLSLLAHRPSTVTVLIGEREPSCARYRGLRSPFKNASQLYPGFRFLRLTEKAHGRPAIISLHWLATLDLLSSTRSLMEGGPSSGAVVGSTGPGRTSPRRISHRLRGEAHGGSAVASLYLLGTIGVAALRRWTGRIAGRYGARFGY